MVALVIMAIIGLMAWRGLDSLIRGKDQLETHSRQQRDLHYALTLLDRDCLAMMVTDDQIGQPVAMGSRSVWWLRQAPDNTAPAWEIVGYRQQSDGLYRLISPPFPTRDKVIEAWRSLANMPDSEFSHADAQLLSSQILRQEVTVLSDAPNKTIPIKALKIRWYLAGNNSGNEKPTTRICLAGGYR